jgi:hypothetical protein
MPYTSIDRIANEAVLETVLSKTQRLSVVLRCRDDDVMAPPSTAALRRYVGEMYSQLWDVALGTQEPDLPDVVIYPQNLPNAAPESWIDIQPDLDCVCSLDSIVGWTSSASSSAVGGRATMYQGQSGNGMGGLNEHVANINSERTSRKLRPVRALHVEGLFDTMSRAAADEHVVFVDDDDDSSKSYNTGRESDNTGLLLAGANPAAQCLYDSVCVGGTFDGLHFVSEGLLAAGQKNIAVLVVFAYRTMDTMAFFWPLLRWIRLHHLTDLRMYIHHAFLCISKNRDTENY